MNGIPVHEFLIVRLSGHILHFRIPVLLDRLRCEWIVPPDGEDAAVVQAVEDELWLEIGQSDLL